MTPSERTKSVGLAVLALTLKAVALMLVLLAPRLDRVSILQTLLRLHPFGR